MKVTDFAESLSSFLTIYLPGQAGLSPNTVASYRDTFKQFLIFAESNCKLRPEKMTLKDFSSECCQKFLEWLTEERNCSASTRNQRLTAILSFANYAMSRYPEFILESQKLHTIRRKKCREAELPYLSTNCMRQILAQPDPLDKYGRRDIVLLSLLYDSGARVQEICDLRVRDVRLQKPYTIVLTGKGRKVRAVPLMESTVLTLKKYLNENRLNTSERTDDYLFVNHQKQQLTRAGISYILKKYCSMAREQYPEIPSPISPHVFRHSKAMHMLQAGINLVYIRDFLGHANVSTTEVYARADTELKRREMEKAMVRITPDLPDWASDKVLMKFLTTLTN